MQQALGNQALQRSLRAGLIRPKLTIGAVGDVYEQEADRMAGRIMQTPDPSPMPPPITTEMTSRDHVRRVCSKCDEELHRQADTSHPPAPSVGESASGSMEVNAPLETRILGMQGGGTPLPPGVRGFFETRFGRDFSDVRVHTDAEAAESASAIQARAYSLGNHIVFGGGQYDPDSSAGRWLIAHELTHTLQQRPATETSDPDSLGLHSSPGDYLARAPCLNPDICSAMTTWKTCIAKSCGSNKSGKCKWTGIEGGCCCLGVVDDTSVLPFWLKALISAGAAAALATCIGTGVCEAGAIVALVGEGLAAAVEAFLISIGVMVADSDTGGTGDSASATADLGATDDATDDQTEVAVQDSDSSDTSVDSETTDDEDEFAA